MTNIGVTSSSVLLRQISNNRAEMDELQVQIATGQKAQSYGKLGSGRDMALSLRQELSQITSYREGITFAQSRVSALNTAVDHMRQEAMNFRSEILVSGFEENADAGKTFALSQAPARLAGVVSMLNTEVGGRYVFAGTHSDTPPVRSAEQILDGQGAQAGFRQVFSERRQADMGADGLGRLQLTQPAPESVSITEDAIGSPFGFKLEAINSNLTGATVSGPAGSPSALQVDFAAPMPGEGEALSLTLSLPDGTQAFVTMTARSGGDLQSGEFQIGADEAGTAANFKAALSDRLAEVAASDLSAASMQAAADDFFFSGTDTPMRVDGPPFETATALKQGTPADTVFWYDGEHSDSDARESAIVRVDEHQMVAYGARADEGSFSTLMKQFAVMSAATFDVAQDGSYEQYQAMTGRVRDQLGFPDQSQSLERVLGELAVAENAMGQAEERHLLKENVSTNFLAELEGVDINEAGAKLLSLQTQLQASYQVTSMLSQLSIVNYI